MAPEASARHPLEAHVEYAAYAQAERCHLSILVPRETNDSAHSAKSIGVRATASQPELRKITWRDPSSIHPALPGFDAGLGALRTRTVPRLALMALVATMPLMLSCGDSGIEPQPPEPTVAKTVSISPAADTIPIGDSLHLVAIALNANGKLISGATIQWSSGIPEIASVDSKGLVQARSKGTTSIIAHSGTATDSALVTVVFRPDRGALVSLYEATDGPNWRNNANWLTDAPLDEWHGVKVEGPSVVGIDLPSNGLAGPVPSQLGDIRRLRVLYLDENSLTGPIPPSLGTLYNLETLSLRSNNLSGPIPPQLGDMVGLATLSLSENSLTGPIPLSLGNPPYLRFLFLYHNQLTGPIPPELGKLTQLTYLLLHANQLTGEIPSELGDLQNLTHLGLGDNDLTGPVPSSFGGLARLTSLALEYNAGLTGPLPTALTNLTQLERLNTVGTSLCVPSSPDLQSWLGGISKAWVPLCESPQLYLTQAVQSRRFPVPLVADEEALFRLFVTAARQNSVDLPDVRATFFVGGLEVHVANVPARSGPIPTDVDEGDMAKSVNALIPATVIRPGLEVVVDVDPDQKLNPELDVTGRIPESGRIALDVRSAPPLDLTFIPFLWSDKPDSTVIGIVDGMVQDPNGHQLLSLVRTLLPVADIRANAHEPVVSVSNDVGILHEEVKMMRAVEGGSGHWMGTITGAVIGGGIASTPGWTSFAFPYDWVIAHELGHNMSLGHAPCRSGDPDYLYPYPNGNIGAWGYDFQKAALVSPNTFDLMSYCAPRWISDFGFRHAFTHQLAQAMVADNVFAAQPTKALLIWGGEDAAGSPFLEPAFVVESPPVLPDAGGEYRVTGRTADGRELFSFRFSMPETADGDGGSSFAFVLPVQAHWGDELAGISLFGPTGSFTLDSGTDDPTVIVRNPINGQVRAILRDLPRGTGPLPPTAGTEPGMRVLFSRGLPDSAVWRR